MHRGDADECASLLVACDLGVPITIRRHVLLLLTPGPPWRPCTGAGLWIEPISRLRRGAIPGSGPGIFVHEGGATKEAGEPHLRQGFLHFHLSVLKTLDHPPTGFDDFLPGRVRRQFRVEERPPPFDCLEDVKEAYGPGILCQTDASVLPLSAFQQPGSDQPRHDAHDRRLGNGKRFRERGCGYPVDLPELVLGADARHDGDRLRISQ